MVHDLHEHTTTDDSNHHSRLETMNNIYQPPVLSRPHPTNETWPNDSISYGTWYPYFPWNPNMGHVGDQFWPSTSEPNEWIETQWEQPLFTPPSDQAIEEAVLQAPYDSTPVAPVSRPPPTLEREQTITTGVPRGVDAEFDMAYELNTDMGMRWKRKRPAAEDFDQVATEGETWKLQSSPTQHELRGNGHGEDPSPQFAPIGNPAIASIGILGQQLQDATRRQLDLVQSHTGISAPTPAASHFGRPQ
ncbi:hypothetical protein NM208_g4715 [Fusarium decemcellulare]|uniref:Uncharacterized protein n=1 Tax=Fusarium decemcellulare TaxID=57161 RepID=A0ACC1SJT5_9HYPO|nr:hypothetical protein NM208_g4715 [Fusarium decemcellulare]